MLFLLVTLVHQLERHKSRQKGCRIQLADQRFHDHEHPCYFVCRGDIPVANGCQGDKAEIGQGLLPLWSEHFIDSEQTEGIGKNLVKQAVEKRKGYAEQQIGGNRSLDSGL